MRRYLFRRLLQNLLTFFLFLTGVYFLIDAQPGDFGNLYLSDPRLTPAQREAIRANLGLDKPVVERYLTWLGNAVQGDFGVSFSNYPRSVLDVIAERAPRTLLLFLSATVISYYVGFLMGKALTWRRGSRLEYGVTIGGVTLYTVFLPWFGLMMIFLFAYSLGWFPIGKFIDPVLWRGSPVEANYIFNRLLLAGLVGGGAAFACVLLTQGLRPAARRLVRWLCLGILLAVFVLYWLNSGLWAYMADMLHHLVLPVLTLALVNFAGTMLLTRNSMLETLREDYVMAARAKGLAEKDIRDRHAARNALLPVITSFVLAVAFVLDGGVITETIFSWPGMGLTLLEAAQREDIPMVVGALVFTGILALTAHLVADILYAILDPRIRYA